MEPVSPPSVDGKNFATHGICKCNLIISKDMSLASSLPPAPPNFNVDGFPWAMRVVAKIVSFQNPPGLIFSTLKFGGWGMSSGKRLFKFFCSMFFFVAKYFPSTVRWTNVFPPCALLSVRGATCGLTAGVSGSVFSRRARQHTTMSRTPYN